MKCRNSCNVGKFFEFSAMPMIQEFQNSVHRNVIYLEPRGWITCNDNLLNSNLGGFSDVNIRASCTTVSTLWDALSKLKYVEFAIMIMHVHFSPTHLCLTSVKFPASRLTTSNPLLWTNVSNYHCIHSAQVSQQWVRLTLLQGLQGLQGLHWLQWLYPFLDGFELESVLLLYLVG